MELEDKEEEKEEEEYVMEKRAGNIKKGTRDRILRKRNRGDGAVI